MWNYEKALSMYADKEVGNELDKVFITYSNDLNYLLYFHVVNLLPIGKLLLVPISLCSEIVVVLDVE